MLNVVDKLAIDILNTNKESILEQFSKVENAPASSLSLFVKANRAFSNFKRGLTKRTHKAAKNPKIREAIYNYITTTDYSVSNEALDTINNILSKMDNELLKLLAIDISAMQSHTARPLDSYDIWENRTRNDALEELDEIVYRFNSIEYPKWKICDVIFDAMRVLDYINQRGEEL